MKLIIESTAKGTKISVVDEGLASNPTIAPGEMLVVHGKTLPDAVCWAIRRANRIAAQVEDRLVELGLVTEEGIETLLATIEQERADGIPADEGPQP